VQFLHTRQLIWQSRARLPLLAGLCSSCTDLQAKKALHREVQQSPDTALEVRASVDPGLFTPTILQLARKTGLLSQDVISTCMREVGKDVVLPRLAVRRGRYNAPHPEVAPPRVPDPMVQERLPTLYTKLRSSQPSESRFLSRSVQRAARRSRMQAC